VQHIAGMKESEIVISINIDENSPIVDESDIFINGRIEDVIPKLVDKIKDQMQAISVRST
jgi:electron transfer flavoprotein alpha subunit